MSGGENSGETSQDASASNNGTKPITDPSIYENRGPKKIIRLITVMAYVFSVSFVAIVLSGYYIFLWEPPNPRLLHTSRYSGEPGVQYFQAHPSFELSAAHDDTYPGHFVIEANNRNNHLASAPVNPRFSDANSALDKSLNVLRNSIVDVLRGYQNNSINSLYVSSKNMSDTKNMTKVSRNNEMTSFKTINLSTNARNSTFNNSEMPATVNSPIISGTEKTVDSTTNRSTVKAYGQNEGIIASALQNPLIQLRQDNIPLRSHSESFLPNGTIKKEPTDDDMIFNNKQLSSHPTKPEVHFAERPILPSRGSQFNASVKFVKDAKIHLTQHLQGTRNYKETQLENVVMRASPVDSEEEVNEITTPQQKGLLALLIESRDTGDVSSSAVMTASGTTSSPSAEDNTSQISEG